MPRIRAGDLPLIYSRIGSAARLVLAAADALESRFPADGRTKMVFALESYSLAQRIRAQGYPQAAVAEQLSLTKNATVPIVIADVVVERQNGPHSVRLAATA
jgi:hypothetical protein